MSKRNSKLKKFLYNPWTIALGTPFLLFLSGVIYNSLKNNLNIFKSVLSVLDIIGNFFYTIMTYKLYVWVVLVIIVFLLIGLFCIGVIIGTKNKNKENTWQKYHYFEYKKWLFTWDYSRTIQGLEIYNLHIVCKNCRCELSQDETYINGSYYSNYYCPNCNSKYEYINQTIIDNVRKIIYHNIDNNEYKTKYIEPGL
jgi:hypothetical protein